MPLLTMITFSELTKQVHLINDLILSDMICENQNHTAEETVGFSRHLLSTKHWFARISWSNKKRYLLALLDDVRSAWTLSLLLKSMWNCRPKDAVLSASEPEVWSSYDQVPTDHNRTAQPVPTLAQVMKNDRIWFLSLEPDLQALLLSELLTVAGGPVMWEVTRRAQAAYQRYREEQLHNLQDSVVLEPPPVGAPPQQSPEKNKKESPQPQRRKSSGSSHSPDWVKPPPPPGQAQKELEANLAVWNATIKSLRDSVKLEEIEMTFNDGSKKKMWKVNRPKPEVVETVDFVQLLPSAVGKRIISYLPRAQLGDYARVNKYWAYLVDDFRAELTARQKIDTDLDKLQELMLRHDTSMDVIAQIDFQNIAPSSQGIMSAAPSGRKAFQPSVRASERSAGAVSFRHMLDGKLTKPVVAQKPLRKLAELTDRLENRGAVDENLWLWCENINKHVKRPEKQKNSDYQEGVLPLGNLHFPCPLMKIKMDVPLKTPLCRDPAIGKSSKPKREISNATMMNVPRQPGIKRYSLWTKDFSKLYPVFKIPSHQSPV
ncbi:uncharacterized protein LOC135075026 [Ostrinia nubilalis]|uniref:uncharacterized protein LOC135075026 n=1 Tax=Ostrinia nubilalis TaxID=29057 RepID=UPI00308244BE